MASPGLRDWDLFCYIPYLTKVNILDCGKCGWNYACIAKNGISRRRISFFYPLR